MKEIIHIVLESFALVFMLLSLLLFYRKYKSLKGKYDKSVYRSNLFYFSFIFLITTSAITLFHVAGSLFLHESLAKIFIPITYIYERGIFAVMLYLLWKYGAKENHLYLNRIIMYCLIIIMIGVGIYIGYLSHSEVAYSFIRKQAWVSFLLALVLSIEILGKKDMYSLYIRSAMSYNFIVIILFAFFQSDIGNCNNIYDKLFWLSHTFKILSCYYVHKFTRLVRSW